MSDNTGSIYVEVGKDNIVTMVHRFPFDPKNGLQCTKEELLQKGVFVDDVPEPEHILGKRSILKYDPDNRKVYYDYKTVAVSTSERLDAMESLMNELIMNGLLTK